MTAAGDAPRATIPGFAIDLARFAGWKAATTLALMLAGALVEGVGLLMLIPLIAVLTGAAGGELQVIAERAFAATGAEGRQAQLLVLVGGFAALVVVRSLLLALRDRQVAGLQAGFVEHSRRRLIRALAGAEWREAAGLRHARVTKALGIDIAQVAGAVHVLMACAVSVVVLAAQSALALWVAPGMAVAALAVMGVGALLLLPVLRRARRIGEALTAGQLTMADAAARFLGGLKLAFAQNMQARFVAAFEADADALVDRQLAFARQQSNLRLVTAAATALTGVVVLAAGVWSGTDGPTLIATLLILSRMSGPAAQLQQGVQQLVHALPAYGALQTLTADLARSPSPPSDAGIGIPDGPVVAAGVVYRHADGRPCLDGVDLVLHPGEAVGLCGPSGAGKTTLADLLAGILEPQEGAISAGGVRLKGAARTAWRDQVAYVSQDPYLFHDTLRRNLAWAAPGASEADLWRVLEAVGADDLVRRMDLGLDTPVGERGARLSGGERQRLALARALLRRPRLLVLDEAGSALDVKSEQAVLARLMALEPRPTLLIIAHRAESLAVCDRILVLEEGRLAPSTDPTRRAAAEPPGPS